MTERIPSVTIEALSARSSLSSVSNSTTGCSVFQTFSTTVEL